MSTTETLTIEQPGRSTPAPQGRKNAGANPEHFAFIDALRGVAILAVITVHVAQQVSGGPMKRFGPKGAFGVQLFFVISAFTLFWSLRSRMTVDRRPIRAYFVRRFFRIAPLFWIAIAFYFYHRGYWSPMFAPAGVGAKQILTAIVFLHGWSPLTCNAIVPGGWSIATEMTFYLFVPILFKRVRSLTGALWVAFISSFLIALTELPLTSHLCRLYPAAWNDLIVFFAYTSFLCQFPVFCFGIVLYFILTGPDSDRTTLSPMLQTRPMALLLALLAPALVLSPAIPEQVIWALAFVGLTAALAYHPFLLAVNPVTRFLGTISFSAYIWHFWIIEKFAAPVIALIGPHPGSVSTRGTVQFAVLYPLTVGLTAIVSFISYRLIEIPGQNIGKALIRLLGWGKPELR
jgi:peptidoglycan/LPS O-acetylase OafA/YrhL